MQILDKGTAQNNIQTLLYKETLDILFAGIAGSECVLSGGAVTAQGSPNQTVAVAKGGVLTNGVLKAFAASASLAVGAADATNPRLDLVVVNSSGALAVRAGTAAATPKPPVRTANDVALAMLYIPANDSTIDSTAITDMRVIRTQGPILIGKSTTPAATNTSLAAVTVMTLTVPSGLFLSGKVIRVKAWGNYLANSGTPTYTLGITYGGTTTFADATVATTAGAARGAWNLEFNLEATGNAAQSLGGIVDFQSPGAKVAPTTGVAGDLAAVADVNSTFNNNGLAVDSDAADRVLAVTWTMNVSNAADEIRVEGWTAEIL
jgi:hypothetical protein